MSALICGSLAYDTIMVFEDRFKNHILPDKVHMLNVAFLVPTLNRAFGGCAGNIAYNHKMLGGDPLPMAAVGQDFEPYRERLDQLGISRQYLLELEDYYTAQAYITTDLDDNQITAFHPGAMMESHRNHVRDTDGIKLGIVAPDGRLAMIQNAEEFVEMGIPFIFDPGQALPLFGGEDFRRFIDQATWVTVNDYESEVIKQRTGWNEDEIAERVEAFIVTKGGDGSCVYTAAGQVIEIPAAKPCRVVDPTGCGDAYRAGLLFGLESGFDWETTGRIATLLGAYKIEQNGTQNHAFTLDEFRQRFAREFSFDF
jgi:adenosine kinase